MGSLRTCSCNLDPGYWLGVDSQGLKMFLVLVIVLSVHLQLVQKYSRRSKLKGEGVHCAPVARSSWRPPADLLVDWQKVAGDLGIFKAASPAPCPETSECIGWGWGLRVVLWTSAVSESCLAVSFVASVLFSLCFFSKSTALQSHEPWLLHPQSGTQQGHPFLPCPCFSQRRYWE